MLKLRKILLCDKLYIITTLLILLLALIITLYVPYKSKYKKSDTAFTCKITKYEIDGNLLDLNLLCKEKIKGSYYIKTKEEKTYLENNLKIGYIVKINGTLNEPKNNTVPFGFNYKKYLYNEKIYYIIDIDELKITNKKLNIFYKIKNYAFKRANSLKKSEYYNTFILGNTSKIDNQVLNSYRLNGISHLFALSGLHVSIFSLVLLKILKKLKIGELSRYIIIFLFLILFSFITNFSPSILRASLLFFLLGINKTFYFFIKTENVLYLVLDILVIINPFIIYNISFLLSFITTYFIVIGSDLINDKSYIKGLLKTSTIAFIGSLGLTLYYFNQINLLSIILNLLFVPLVSFIIFPLSILSFILPILNNLFVLLINILEKLSLLLNNISLKITFPHIPLIYIFIYYILVFILIKFKKKKLLIPLILLLIFLKIKPLLNTNTIVFFIDVGQGDSTGIVMPHNKETFLIDTGGKLTYKMPSWKEKKDTYSISLNTLIPFFKSLGITKIDYLILTHGDADHMGESINLINNFKIKNVILNNGPYNNLEKNLIELLERKKINYTSNINKIKTKDITLNFLNTKLYDNENDNSNVILTNINNTSILLMGDAGIEKENDILKKYKLNIVDFLKVGHHGSNTSSSETFIKKITPKYSIISVGENNKYNHPNKEVLNILKSSKILRTDLNGTIELKINKKSYKIKLYSP